MQVNIPLSAMTLFRRLISSRRHVDARFSWRGVRKVALATMFITVAFIYLGQMAWWKIILPFSSEGVYLAATPLSTIVATVIGITYLWRTRIPYSIELTVVALIVAHWLEKQFVTMISADSDMEYGLMFTIISYASYAIFLFAAYAAAYVLFTVWRAPYKYKLIAAGIVISLVLGSELIQIHTPGDYSE